MRKFPLAVVCVIALCSLLTVPLLPRPASPTSSETPQSAAQIPSQQTPQTPPEATPKSPPPKTVQKPSPQLMPETASPNPQQIIPQPTPPSGQPSTNRTLQEAIGNATGYLAKTEEPYALLMLNVLYRRFGITEFANSLNHYDQLLAKNPENAPLLRVFRRIADYYNYPQPIDRYAVTVDVDQITVPALYADRAILPENYGSMLIDAASKGDYLLTHALLATIWLQENHCEWPVSDDFRELLYRANAVLIGNGSVVNDLRLEAAAFLYVAGQGTLVNNAFVQSVIETQNYDGGWSNSSDPPDGSYWHPSVLALMLLLNVEFPVTSYPPMLALATSYDGIGLNPMTVCSIAVVLFVFVNVKKKTVQFRISQSNHVA